MVAELEQTRETLINEEQQELEPKDVLSPFERNWYSGLYLLPDEHPPFLRPKGEDFARLVEERFPEDFFQVDETYASQAIAWSLLKNWPDEVPVSQFEQDRQAVTQFCLQVVPIVEQTRSEKYPFAASRVVHSSVGALSTLRDHFGLRPLLNQERTGLLLSIDNALTEQEAARNGEVPMVKKKEVTLGIIQ